MDFFASQEAARRKTSLLICYFLAAVALMIAALYFAALLALSSAGGLDMSRPNALWRPDLLLPVGLITIGVITPGSLYKTLELRAGGERIAAMLGGRKIRPNTTDLAERRLLNVVEEMALASGVPAPPVFVLDNERSINAFAAGFTPGDAVIGVNRGSLDYLTRDELQGVMAHEFSHILNGDMRLNLRLIGILHGILLIALIGYYMLRLGSHSGRRGGKRDGKGAAPIMLMGLAAFVIGYIGLFFARLIKAAVSRQREYLGDASSVQFTRNPAGISGALKKIGGLALGSRMTTPEAETASHMFFGSAFRPSMFQALATHPPLVERIRRIDPQFDGRFPKPVPLVEEAGREVSEDRRRPEPAGFGLGGRWGLPKAGETIPLDPVLVMAAVGAPNTGHVEFASQMVASLPKALVDAARDPFGARAIVFAMLLDEDQTVRDKQLRLLDAREGEPTRRETVRLAPLVTQQGAAARLPIIELLQNALGDISPQQYQRFRGSVIELVKADEQISLFEFVLQRVLLANLDRRLLGTKPAAARYSQWAAVADQTADLISALAHAGQSSDERANQAFQQAVSSLAPPRPLTLRPRSQCSLAKVHEALNKLSQSAPMIKKRVLSAAAACIAADGQVTVAEAELLRAVADSLDCPLPPIAAGREQVLNGRSQRRS